MPNTVKEVVNSYFYSYLYMCSYATCTAKEKPFIRSTSASE